MDGIKVEFLIQLGSYWMKRNDILRGISLCLFHAAVLGILVCLYSSFGDVIWEHFHQDIEHRLSEENAAASCTCFSNRTDVLRHHEAKLWHTDTKKEWESQESQKNIVFVKWHSGKKLFIYLGKNILGIQGPKNCPLCSW